MVRIFLHTILEPLPLKFKPPNCLIENLFEMETLPHVNIYSKLPGRKQSGERDPQRRITKQEDRYLRQLLVNCSQDILGPFGMDSD